MNARRYYAEQNRWHGWAIALGEKVQDRKGRIGVATQVNTRVAFVRFDGAAKAVQMDRLDLTPLSVLAALAEVDEDEANRAEYNLWRETVTEDPSANMLADAADVAWHKYRPTRQGVCDTCGRRQRTQSHLSAEPVR